MSLTRKQALTILLLITVLGTALRFYALGRYSIWNDEAVQIRGGTFVDADLTFFDSGEGRIIALPALISFLWQRVLEVIPGAEPGTEALDFWYRFPSALFGALTIPALYGCGLLLTGSRKAALWGAMFLAISPFHIYFAQEFREFTLYVLLMAVATPVCVWAIREDRFGLWAAASVLTAMSFYLYYFSMWWVIMINLWALVVYRRDRVRVMKWLGCQVAAGIMIIPAALMALTTYGHRAEGNEEDWLFPPTLKLLVMSVKSYFAGHSPRAEVYWALLMMAVLLMAVGVVALRQRKGDAALLVAWAVAPLLFQYIFWNLQDFVYYTHRLQLAYSLPCFVLMGAGVTLLRNRVLRFAVAGAFVALTLPTIYDVYAQNLHPGMQHRLGTRHKIDNRAAANYVRSKLDENDVILHASSVTMGPFRHHYLPHEAQTNVGFTKLDEDLYLRGYPDPKMWNSYMFWPTRMETALEGHPRAWFISSWWEPFDYASFPREIRLWLDTHGQRIDRRAFDGLTVYQYDFAPERLGMARFPIVDSWTDQVMVYAPHAATEWGDPTSNASILKNFPAASESDPLNYLEMSLQYGIGAESGAAETQIVARGQQEALWINALGDHLPIAFRSRRDEPITLSGQMLVSTAAFSAMAMHQDIASNTWRPVCGYYGQPNMRAGVNTEDPEGSLSVCVPLSDGVYDIHLRLYRSAQAEDHPRGRIAIGGEGLVQTESVDTSRIPEGEAEGWAWVRVGTVKSIADELCFQVQAELSDGQREAIVDFERIMITPAGMAPGRIAFQCEVPANGEIAQMLRPEFFPGARRVDIEAFDPYGAVRMVSMPVHGDDLLEGARQ